MGAETIEQRKVRCKMLDLQSVYFGQRHKDFTYQDFDLIKKIQRLARKHQKQCENSCNGVGYVNGQAYTTALSHGQEPGEYEKREFGYNVKSAYINKDDEDCIFDIEAGKIEEKIVKELVGLNQTKYALWRVKPFKLEFQGDPRGATVRLFYDGDYIEL
jgi:hypothetical protein